MDESLRLADGGLAALRDGMTIGRHPESDLRLDAPSVSREHAVVRGTPGRWYVEDRGSRNGTRVNADRLAYGQPHPFRHADVITVGDVVLVVTSTSSLDDPDRTETLDGELPTVTPALSPFQLAVLRHLAAPWARGQEPASNVEIASALGTPSAEEAVKAALRRTYAKVGLTEQTHRGKRRALCQIARRNGWI